MNEAKSTEDYKFRAELTWADSGLVFVVPCKLFLPKKVRERPRLILYPDPGIWHLLGRASNCELRGSLGEGLGSVSINASDVRIGSGNQRRWGDGLDEGYFLCYPKQLRITRNLGKALGKNRVAFYLTKSLLLSPSDIITNRYDGSVQVKHVKKLQFKLNSNCQLSFQYEYRHRQENQGETISWTELMACADIVPLPAGISPEDLLPQIDDLLLLVSLAEGQRCACMEVVWSQQGQLIHLFRFDRTFPIENINHSVNDCLTTNIDNFLTTTYASLRDFPERRLLWSALASITWFEATTIGDDYLRLFTALETMVLAFRRINGLEFIVNDKSKRDQIGKDIKKFIKNHSLLKDDSGYRGMLYENISGLLRISFKCATMAFAEAYNVRLDDVWPLFEPKDKWSLLNIRNKIVHGEHFSEGEWRDIAEAKRSLRIIAERFILNMLSWDYQETKVHWNDSAKPSWRLHTQDCPLSTITKESRGCSRKVKMR